MFRFTIALTLVACLLSSVNAVQPSKIIFRTWRSIDGKFTTKAKLIEIQKDAVRLLREDDKEITVPKKKLSPADIKYCERMHPILHPPKQESPHEIWQVIEEKSLDLANHIQAIYDSNGTSAQKATSYQLAYQKFSEGVIGKKASAYFVVEDVAFAGGTAETPNVRLSLSKTSLPNPYSTQAAGVIDIPISSSRALQIQKGSVIEAKGTIGERTNRMTSAQAAYHNAAIYHFYRMGGMTNEACANTGQLGVHFGLQCGYSPSTGRQENESQVSLAVTFSVNEIRLAPDVDASKLIDHTPKLDSTPLDDDFINFMRLELTR